MAEAPYITATYNSYEDRYLAELVVDYKVVDSKYLTAHEAKELDTWLQFLHMEQEAVHVPVAEILEHQQDGYIFLDEESNLLHMLEKAHNG